MKIRVKRLDAAESQLIEAIKLFFEERDPVSIHTLVSAAKQILLDHVSKEDAQEHKLFSHRNTPLLKDNDRKRIHKIMKEPANFFKHADEDIKINKHEIEFEQRSSEHDMDESIHCIGIIKDNAYVGKVPEFFAFTTWYIVNVLYVKPHHDELLQELYQKFKNHKKPDYLKLIQDLKNNHKVIFQGRK